MGRRSRAPDEHGSVFSRWLIGVPLALAALAALAFGCTRHVSGAEPLTAGRILGPVPVPAGNPQTPDKIELGKLLFFDKRLSADNATACANCHDPAKGWSDGLPRSVSTAGEMERNSISLFNIAYEDFPAWDGFAASLEEHNGAALTFDFGAGAQDVPELIRELTDDPGYRERFGKAFAGEISFTSVIRALAAFERSVLTFSSDFDRFADGDRSRLTAEQQDGLALFMGRAACSSCHIPPLFTDNRFHALGVPQAGPLAEDPGRFAVTGDEGDRGAFRTPTLRNLTLTAPYMHDGVFTSLDEVVAFYDAGGGAVPGRSGPEIGPLHLSAGERKALVAYLESLTDTSPQTVGP